MEQTNLSTSSTMSLTPNRIVKQITTGLQNKKTEFILNPVFHLYIRLSIVPITLSNIIRLADCDLITFLVCFD